MGWLTEREGPAESHVCSFELPHVEVGDVGRVAECDKCQQWYRLVKAGTGTSGDAILARGGMTFFDEGTSWEDRERDSTELLWEPVERPQPEPRGLKVRCADGREDTFHEHQPGPNPDGGDPWVEVDLIVEVDGSLIVTETSDAHGTREVARYAPHGYHSVLRFGPATDGSTSAP